MSFVIIGDQDSQALEDAGVSGPYLTREAAEKACELLCGDANHGTYYVTELLPPFNDEDEPPPLEHATFETIFERLPTVEANNRIYRQCPFCPSQRTRLMTMATHIDHHHRDQLSGAETLLLDDYLRENRSQLPRVWT